MLLLWLICLSLWSAAAVGCISVGSTDAGTIWSMPFGSLRDRAEVVVLASVVGAALAAAGVVYQSILGNPLADPYLLGVSSGASLASYLWRFPGPAIWSTIAVAAGQESFAVAGAVLSVGIVFVLSTRRGRLEPVTLLLVGVIVNAVNGSVFLLLDSIYRELSAASGGTTAFLVGRLQTSLTTGQESAALVTVAACWLIVAAAAGALNVASLDESEATALGVRIHLLRWVMLATASVMTAAAVAVAGPIGFVGLVCPHLGRLVVKADVRRLLPVATMLGAILLAGADAASRWLSNGQRLGTAIPVGVITGLIGGPFFLLLLYRSRNRRL